MLFAFVAATVLPTVVAVPPAGADPVIAYPSLRIAMPANNISIAKPTQSTRVLDFTHITWNAGAGPLEFQPTLQPGHRDLDRSAEPVHADRPHHLVVRALGPDRQAA